MSIQMLISLLACDTVTPNERKQNEKLNLSILICGINFQNASINEIVNHETISFCLPRGKADHTPPKALSRVCCPPEFFGGQHGASPQRRISDLDFRSIGVSKIKNSWKKDNS